MKSKFTIFFLSIFIISCDASTNDGGSDAIASEVDMVVSVEKLEPYRSDCDVTFRVTNKTNRLIESDSISMFAADAQGTTLSRMLVNVMNVRPGRSVAERTYAMNVDCNEIRKFTSLSASYSNVGPDPDSLYPFE